MIKSYPFVVLSPIVHEHVRLPELVRRDPEVLDPAILAVVPPQVVVIPLLHIMSTIRDIDVNTNTSASKIMEYFRFLKI